MNLKTCLAILSLASAFPLSAASAPSEESEAVLGYHTIRMDDEGHILPWHPKQLGDAYDHTLQRVWHFWSKMGLDRNGLPYFLNHQVWRNDFPDRRGAGGDQFAMALSSLRLLYAYLGDELAKEEMKVIADLYLAHSLSPVDSKWPNLPFPYNTLLYSGRFDGDMIAGVGYTQPDKAGSFGYELVQLYKMTGNERYLNAAIGIADTLARNIRPGDHDHSPWPFKVNVFNGNTARLGNTYPAKSEGAEGAKLAEYTTNYAATLGLFLELEKTKTGNIIEYEKARVMAATWMLKFPVKNNRWGPFFEDIPGWSDTQINAVTWAEFMMEHRELFPDWQRQVRSSLNWVYEKLADMRWSKFGVIAIREQTAYQVPGNSHTARQASAELRYAELTNDLSRKEAAIRQLNWATYMVDHDGKNQYPFDEVWLTDGYGDYIRHYLRAMAAAPELSPLAKDSILRSTSPLSLVEYEGSINRFVFSNVPPELISRLKVRYKASDVKGTEVVRLRDRPKEVYIGEELAPEGVGEDSWTWSPLASDGLLYLRHSRASEVWIVGEVQGPNPQKESEQWHTDPRYL